MEPGDRALLRVLGVATACIAVAVTVVSPRQIGPLPEGMNVPVVAFEVARTQGEVERMFGAAVSAQRAEWRTRMALGVWLDYALLLAYGLFLSAVAGSLGPFMSPRPVRSAVALAVFAAACDALENRELLIILQRLGIGYGAALGRLAWFTWLKWLALGAYFVVLAPALWRTRRLAHRAAALTGALAAISAVLALVMRGRVTDLMSSTTALAIALLTVGAFVALPSPRSAERAA